MLSRPPLPSSRPARPEPGAAEVLDPRDDRCESTELFSRDRNADRNLAVAVMPATCVEVEIFVCEVVDQIVVQQRDGFDIHLS